MNSVLRFMCNADINMDITERSLLAGNIPNRVVYTEMCVLQSAGL